MANSTYYIGQNAASFYPSLEVGIALKRLRAEKERLEIEKSKKKGENGNVKALQEAEVASVNQAFLLKTTLFSLIGLLLGFFGAWLTYNEPRNAGESRNARARLDKS